MGFGPSYPTAAEAAAPNLSSGRDATRTEAPLLHCQAGVSTGLELTTARDEQRAPAAGGPTRPLAGR